MAYNRRTGNAGSSGDPEIKKFHSKQSMQTKFRFIKNCFVSLFFVLALFLCFETDICGQQISPLWGELPNGRYGVGYKTLIERDGSRSFPKKSGASFISGTRQIKISLWYPAQNSGKPKMKFREYLSALEDAASIPEKSESRSGFTQFSVLQELPEAAIANLLAISTAATRNAPFLKGEKFPLVILGQGLYYESPATHTILCEFLASQGFIVATTNLVGAHSPFVKLDAVDLEADVRDLEFVISRARLLEGADKEKLAVAGFDMGGLAGLILTMRNREVDAFASLDSGIMAEHNLRLVKAMADYDALRLGVPLFHATRPAEELARFGVSEDTSFLDAARFSDRLVLRFPGARHADFTSRPMIEFIAAQMRDEATTRRRLSFEATAQNLSAFLKAHLKNDRQALEFLYSQAVDKPSAKIKFKKERKAATRRPTFTEDEFLNYLYSEGAEKATNLYRKLRTEFPNERIFRESTLKQIGYNRLYRGEASEAIGIFKLNVEAFPDSSSAYETLAQAYALSGDIEAAKSNYKKSLRLDPNNENAKTQLKRLEEKK